MSVVALAPRPAPGWEDWLEDQVADHAIPTLHLGRQLLTPAPPRPSRQLRFASHTVFLEFVYGFGHLGVDGDIRARFLNLAPTFQGVTESLRFAEPPAGAGHRRDAWTVCVAAQRAWWALTDEDPLAGDIWPVWGYLPDVNYDSARQGYRTIDWTVIRTPWLRAAAKAYANEMRPAVGALRKDLRCLSVADDALVGCPAQRPQDLRSGDATAVWRHITSQPVSAVLQAAWVSRFFGLVSEYRAMGVPVSAGFMRRPSHKVAKPERGHRRDLPDTVIERLDAHLNLLESSAVDDRLLLPAEVVRSTRTTIYLILRDTGRRLNEVCTLRRNCVEENQHQFSLRYDNHKARRNGRLLPITAATAEIIAAHQALLDTHDIAGDRLFPALGAGAKPHVGAGWFSDLLRIWADRCAPFLDDDGDPFPPERITSRAFRHTYAQRHADAGVEPDVLRRLLDHENIATTGGYYRVTDTRKREAVAAMSAYVIDRAGRPRPFDSTDRQRIGTVAVPFGMCTEPTNVDAGGQSCPIRFQCSGCSHYRTDPSYVPVLEEHIASLRMDLERATALDVEPWTIAGITTEIASFERILADLRAAVGQMPDDDRHMLERHAAVLRKARSATKVELRGH